jgi:hypothetical protein
MYAFIIEENKGIGGEYVFQTEFFELLNPPIFCHQNQVQECQVNSFLTLSSFLTELITLPSFLTEPKQKNQSELILLVVSCN